MSITLKRYAPTSKYVDTGIGGYDEIVMKESPGGNYIDEDELRKVLGGLMNAARSRDELAAYQRVTELIDTSNW